jgi:teichuronic acid biosynthesis glycosyltransferase TuaC
MNAIPIATCTSLFPNREMPRHGLFVERRLRELCATGRIRATVLAPVPWFPLRSRRFGTYATFARVPGRESQAGLEVLHPRYLMVPKIGVPLQARSFAAALEGPLRELQRAGRVCVLDAHYFYPDGVAAASVGRRLGIPVIVTARGSDVNIVARNPLVRRKILSAAAGLAAIVTVSDALRQALVDMGIPGERIQTLRNGVDLATFMPAGHEAARAELRCSRYTLLSVGRLVPGKGHVRVVEALAELPDCDLIIAGDGPDRERILSLAAKLGVSARLRLAGEVDTSALVKYYRAADASVLASDAEGMPNVVLESLACGTPVIATRVGGVPEVLDETVGRIVPPRDTAALASAVRSLQADPPDRTRVRAWGERFGWSATIASLAALIERVSRDGTAA